MLPKLILFSLKRYLCSFLYCSLSSTRIWVCYPPTNCVSYAPRLLFLLCNRFFRKISRLPRLRYCCCFQINTHYSSPFPKFSSVICDCFNTLWLTGWCCEERRSCFQSTEDGGDRSAPNSHKWARLSGHEIHCAVVLGHWLLFCFIASQENIQWIISCVAARNRHPLAVY
jgi:hypothetical protein